MGRLSVTLGAKGVADLEPGLWPVKGLIEGVEAVQLALVLVEYLDVELIEVDRPRHRVVDGAEGCHLPSTSRGFDEVALGAGARQRVLSLGPLP